MQRIILSGKVYFTKEKIVKICQAGVNQSYGYDLDSEELLKIPNEDLTEFPKAALVMLGSEKVRFKIAREFYDDKTKIAAALDVSIRTFYRIHKDLHTEN